MKEKKIILSVVFGVSLVALLIAAISGFADSLSLLADGKKIYMVSYQDDYDKLVGGLQLGAACLGIVIFTGFILELIFAQKRNVKNGYLIKVIISTVLAIAFIIYTFVTLFYLKNKIPLSSNNKYSTAEYTLMLSYVSSVITIAVTSLLALLSSLFLFRKDKAKEQQ